MATVNKGILTKFYTDSDGNVISIKVNREQSQVSSINYVVTLEGIPEEFNRVTCINKNTGDVYTEVNSLSALQEGCFYVDYQLGKVYFNSTEAGKVVLFNYYSQGYELISTTRVFDETAYHESDIVRTLQDIIDAGRKGLDYLENIGQGDTLVTQLQEQVAIGNTCYSNLKSTVDRGDSLNVTLEANIQTATTKNTTLLNNLSTVDSKNSTLTSTINSAKTAEGSLNTTIDTANSTKSTLTNSINTGNTLNTNLKDTTTKANQALSDLNTAIGSSDLSAINTNLTNLLRHVVVVGTLSELETAISNIGRAGYSGHILIKAGTYTPTKSYELPAYTTIEALGDGEVIFKCNSTSINNIFRNKLNGTETGYNGAGGITIRGITFDGYDTTNQITCVAFAHARNCFVEKCNFKRFNNWHNIEFNGCAFCYARHNQFSNYGNTNSTNATEVIQLDYCGGSVVYPWTCKYDNTQCYSIYIEYNEFSNIVGACIGNHSFITDGFVNEVYINKNHFYNCQHGVYIGNVNNLYVNENYFEKCVFGIEIKEGSGQGISKFCFDNNTFIGMKGQTGFTEKDKENRFIRIEALRDDGSNYQVVSNVKITNNKISNCNSHGIGVFGNFIDCVNNTITDCGKIGIFFYCVWAGKINNNTCQGNGTYNQGWRNYDIAVGGYDGSRQSWNIAIVGNLCESICGLNGCPASAYCMGNSCDCINVNGGQMVQK